MISMALAACFLSGFYLFLVSASPTVSFEDSGELISAAASLGITHPPGYPWLAMLWSLAQHVPLGSPAFRMNLVSAVCGAVAVQAVYATTRLLLGRTAGGRFAGWMAPTLAAAAFATSRTLWWQSGIAEKYTLSIALMAWTIYLLVRMHLAPRASDGAALGLLTGISMSHHLHALHLAPVTAAAWWWGARGAGAGRIRHFAVIALLAIVPMALKAAVIPVMTQANKTMCWGVPDTPGRLVSYLAARQYKGGMFRAAGPGEAVERFFVHLAVLPLAEFGPALALAVPGAAALSAASPELALGVAATLATNLALTVPYTASGIDLYQWELLSSRRYLTSYALLAILMGLGAARLRRVAPATLVTGILCLILAPFGSRSVAMRSEHFVAYDFAVNQLATVSPNALLFCEGDEQAFPLIYVTDVLKFRQDVTVIGMPDACNEISARRIAERHPGLVMPPFIADPGRQLPHIILANAPAHPAFYTPGCTGNGSERVLVPNGVSYEAHLDPTDADLARRRFTRFPRLRLRGAADAAGYGDPMTENAARAYGLGMAYHGAAALEHAQFAEAEHFLRDALRFPMLENVRAVALTHLGMTLAATGRIADAEPLYRQALAVKPDLGTAMLQLAKALAVMRRDPTEIRALLYNAARHPEFLTERDRQELMRFVGGRR